MTRYLEFSYPMRKLWPTPGGIHPAANKRQSTRLPIGTVELPSELILPLMQTTGALESVVDVGQHVLKGQVIAVSQGVLGVPVHAPSSGQIKAIEPRPIAHPSGMLADCIIIAPDGQEHWIANESLADYHSVDKKTLLQRINQAGIAGLGGAGFPTEIKLSAGAGKTIDTLIINGAECEPYITADDCLMRERAADIIAGIAIVQHLVEPTKETLVGVEDNKPEAIAAMRQAAMGTNIDIVAIATKYPAGGEKQLIQTLTGKEVPSGGLPVDVGIICQNVGTVAAIYRAICHGEPLISRVVTVAGQACDQPRNIEVLFGTPMRFLLDACGFRPPECSRLVMGGPMMGFTLTNDQAPVIKTTNCLLAATTDEMPTPPLAQACIRCGLCAEACPASLLPQQLYWFARGKEYDKLETHQLMDCIECGACSYVCPSNIPLVQYYRASKAEIRQQKHDHLQAEQAKQRFEARNQRLESQAAEKEAKRRARQQQASTKDKQQALQDAIERVRLKRK